MTSAGVTGLLARVAADLVAGAVDVAGLDAAAGQHQAVAEVPVVAAGAGVDLRRAAELAHHHDQRAFQHAAIRPGRQEARHRRVELRQQFVLELGEVVAVRVPGGVGVRCPGDAGDARAGLDQPPRQQHALTVDVAAVAVAHRGRLAVELKRLLGRWRGEQVEGPGLEAVHLPGGRFAVRPPRRSRRAGARGRRVGRRRRRRQAQLRHGESRGVRIAQDEQRVADAAEQPPKKPGCGGPPAPSSVMYGIDT